MDMGRRDKAEFKKRFFKKDLWLTISRTLRQSGILRITLRYNQHRSHSQVIRMSGGNVKHAGRVGKREFHKGLVDKGVHTVIEMEL